MNKSGIAAALMALVLNAPTMAADCMLPAPPLSSLSVAAPEMQSMLPADPACVRAQDALASLRAPTYAPGAYVPLTKDDNTPWRFDMSQNGKRMTSVEFDAWMKAKGIRVATGKPAVQSAAEGSPPAEPVPSGQ